MADRRPGRPRDATVEARVLGATQELLVEVGFDQLTIDAVADRCGMSTSRIVVRHYSSPTAARLGDRPLGEPLRRIVP